MFIIGVMGFMTVPVTRWIDPVPSRAMLERSDGQLASRPRIYSDKHGQRAEVMWNDGQGLRTGRIEGISAIEAAGMRERFESAPAGTRITVEFQRMGRSAAKEDPVWALQIGDHEVVRYEASAAAKERLERFLMYLMTGFVGVGVLLLTASCSVKSQQNRVG